MNKLPFLRTCWVIAVVAGLIFSLAGQMGYRLNTTRSAPLGIWRIASHGAQSLKVGDWVTICPPANATIKRLVAGGFLLNGYCPGGVVPFIKPVAGLSGDDFSVSHLGVSINGRLIANTAPVRRDGLPWAGPTVIPEGHFVGLQTFHPRSIDSRYFGPLPVDAIIGVMEPVWIESAGS